MNKIRVLIADDHELIRQGIRAILHSDRTALVLGEAVTGLQAVEQSQRLHPDVVIMDLMMPELDGIEATRRIRGVSPNTRVIVLTMHNSEIMVRRVLNAGASGYVLKSELASKLKTALRVVSRGKRYLSHQIAEVLMNRYLQGTTLGDEPPPGLTNREQEVSQLLSLGKGSKEIGEILKITARTVDTHRANIMRKLNVHSVTELLHKHSQISSLRFAPGPEIQGKS